MGSSNTRQRREQRERATKAAALRRTQQAKERRRRLLLTSVAVVAALAVIAGITIAALAGGDDRESELTGVRTFTVEQGHTTDPVSYPQTPPVGGPHHPTWLNCGAYDQPVPNENAVHSLEHGAVWITYAPDLPAGQVDTLEGLARSRTYVTVSPYPGLPAPVVASAWGKQLRLTGADDPRLTRFLTEYVQGPQTPEPGAPCTGGTGSPTS